MGILELWLTFGKKLELVLDVVGTSTRVAQNVVQVSSRMLVIPKATAAGTVTS
jgi:hypothetical protein